MAVQVLPGARVPADGEVVEGRGYVDESMVTGESRPISKRAGDSVIGGTVNNSNVLIIRVSERSCWSLADAACQSDSAHSGEELSAAVLQSAA